MGGDQRRERDFKNLTDDSLRVFIRGYGVVVISQKPSYNITPHTRNLTHAKAFVFSITGESGAVYFLQHSAGRWVKKFEPQQSSRCSI